MKTKAQKFFKVMRINFEETFKKFIPNREEWIEHRLEELQHQKREFNAEDPHDRYYVENAIDALHFYNLALKELIKEVASLQEELQEREHDARVKLNTIARCL